jgi:protein-S-isoprenylcysteine O-methyltransferase Ste14
MRMDCLSLLAAVLCTAGMVEKALSFWHSGQLVVLGVAVFYGLLATLFITRLPSQQAETRLQTWIVCLGGTFIPFLISCSQPGVLPQWAGLGTVLQGLGLVLMLLALMQLGRGFGVIPAVRAVKTHGLYQWVRHPLYAAEIVFMTGLILQVATPWNGLVFALFVCLQFYRAWLEENLLATQTVAYQTYLSQVKYRFIPFVF